MNLSEHILSKINMQNLIFLIYLKYLYTGFNVRSLLCKKIQLNLFIMIAKFTLFSQLFIAQYIQSSIS